MEREQPLKLGWASLLAVLLLVACTSQAWKQDPEVQAVRRTCQDLEYGCIERRAVETLDPDVCRLAGIWVDDMCLQAVYEAAGDPAICERLYLEGVRPTCRAYYAQRSTTLRRHTDRELGFAASVPHDWQAGSPHQFQDPLGRTWSAIEFSGNLHPYGEQAFAEYGIRVEMAPTASSTLTEAVELSLSPLTPEFRERVQILCCRRVGGEEALEMLYFPPTHWGNRRTVVLHRGWEYHLDFYPLLGLEASTPAGIEAQFVFEALLETFSFLPRRGAPGQPAPRVTPIPTPSVSDTGASCEG